LRILINKPQQETEKYSLLSTCPVIPLTDTGNLNDQDVIALVEDGNFDVTLKTAVGCDVPVVCITTKDSKCYQQALSIIHPHAVIYHENGQILSSQKVFAEAPGLSVKTLEEICKYALENKMYPDVYVWKPQEDIINFAEPPQEIPQKPLQEPSQDTVKPVTPKQKTKAYTPAQTDLKTYINSCDRIIAVFKTSSSADSNQVAANLAKQLNTVHLNIAAGPVQKQNPYYACSDGNLVNYNSSIMPGQYLIVEVDAQISEALEMIYGMAYKIVHVTADPNESLEPLRAWAGSGFRLDAVIPTQIKDIPAYNEFPAYSIEDFVQSL
jgi:hypothetical protein